MIQDPVGNRFFRIGWLNSPCCRAAPRQTPQALLAAVRAETPLSPRDDELLDLLDFPARQQLLWAIDAAASIAWRSAPGPHRHGMEVAAAQLPVHPHPLWRPGRFLRRPCPSSRAVLAYLRRAVALLTLAGLVLAARQRAAFPGLWLPGQAFLRGTAGGLPAGLGLHQKGPARAGPCLHGVPLRRHGVRAAHGGRALLGRWPVLYTDTSESWKLTDRRKRFHIAGAGILVETMDRRPGHAGLEPNRKPRRQKRFLFSCDLPAGSSRWTLNASPLHGASTATTCCRTRAGPAQPARTRGRTGMRAPAPRPVGMERA